MISLTYTGRLRSLFLIVFISAFSCLNAQTDSSLAGTYKGGFFQLNTGVIFNNSYDFKSEINRFDGVNPTLAKDIKTSEPTLLLIKNLNTAPTVGVESMVLLEGGVLLGAKGDFNFLSNVSNDVAQVKMNSFSVHGMLGKAVYNYNNLFVYPYIGVGFYRYQINIKNVSPTGIIRFDPADPIPAGEDRTYFSAYPVFDLGLGVKKVFAKRYTVGLEVGGFFSSTAHSSLRGKAGIVEYRQAPGVSGGFIKFTFELFKFGKKVYIDSLDKPVFIPAPEEEKVKVKAKEEVKEKEVKPAKEVKKEKKKEVKQEVKEEEPAPVGKKARYKRPSKKPPREENINDQFFDFGKPDKKDTIKDKKP